jgi:hypothetical protein
VQSAHVGRRQTGRADWDAIVALYDPLLALTASPRWRSTERRHWRRRRVPWLGSPNWMGSQMTRGWPATSRTGPPEPPCWPVRIKPPRPAMHTRRQSRWRPIRRCATSWPNGWQGWGGRKPSKTRRFVLTITDPYPPIRDGYLIKPGPPAGHSPQLNPPPAVHSAISTRRARYNRDTTVPTGTPVIRAIS